MTELDLAPPGPTELLVRMEAAGVCHSDLSVIDGSRPRTMPLLLGHEAAGTVEEIGADVDPGLLGQRVVMTFQPRCERCDACASEGRVPCSAGTAANGRGELLLGGSRIRQGNRTIRHHLGVSGFATHAVVDASSAVPVGFDVPPAVAAVLGCAVLTGGGAIINTVRPTPGDSVMIVGLGGVGMAALITAVAEGAGRVIAVDPHAPKLEIARGLGAHETYTPKQLSEKAIKARYVVECAGNTRAFTSAFAATEVGGTTVTVGLPAPTATVDITPLTLAAEARTIVGSYLGTSVPSRDIPRFVEMWRSGRLPVESLISSYIGLGDLNKAMDELASGVAIRQVVLFDHESQQSVHP